MLWDTLWTNATIAKMDEGYGLLQNAALGIQAGKIIWLGRMEDLPNLPTALAREVIDAKARCITPALIDCHTHLVYAGNRALEFEQRLQGQSYTEIAKQGGGIQATVTATRLASEDELYTQSLARAAALFSQGVMTLEIKTGYGLDVANELKQLRVTKRIARALPITVSTTFLGAHTVPKEYQGRQEAYIESIIQDILPALLAEGGLDALDVFCESIGFTLQQTERLFQLAKQHQLHIKCHAEQLTASGAARLAASYEARSVDHLEHLQVEAIPDLKRAGTVAVLLPGAYYFLRETQKPPVDALRAHAVPIAIATDCNPGTSPTTSLLTVMNMACTLFGLTTEEAWLGVTKHAAQALGLQNTHGVLAVERAANFVVWDVDHPRVVVYGLGSVMPHALVVGGAVEESA